MTEKKDLAPDGRPKMVIGKVLWKQLEEDDEDMRWYRLSEATPLNGNKLFKQH